MLAARALRGGKICGERDCRRVGRVERSGGFRGWVVVVDDEARVRLALARARAAAFERMGGSIVAVGAGGREVVWLPELVR
jgi:hypothetical protein